MDEKKLKAADLPVVDFVDFTGLSRFKTNLDEDIAKKLAEQTHTADQITETTEKKFVSPAEKERWNNTYTKTEVDNKLSSAIGGLSFKGVFATIAELPQTGKDGDYAVVTADPKFEGQNRLFMYETTEPAGWKDYGSLILPGKATESVDGLMSKEQVVALNTAVQDIVKLKSGEAITALDAGKVTQDAQHRFVTDTEKASYADKYTKTEADAKHGELKTATDNVKQELDSYKTSNDQRVQAIEEKIAKIATPEQIDALFGKKKK